MIFILNIFPKNKKMKNKNNLREINMIRILPQFT
jgi:hypothetical protein